MKLLEAKNLQKKYKHVHAVKGIDFHLNEGEILGFLGPNGAGKSVTISMISSLVPPTEGEILFKGESILKNPRPLRQVLGVVPQEIALYPDLTGYENLSFFGRLYGLRGKELQKRITEVLEVIGLSERASEKVENYSGGMKRRINIGAALLHRPQILIMDEPTVGIDPQSRNHILQTVKELNKQGMSILYTSHYMEEVEFLCDRIYILDSGQVIASGTKEELKQIVSKGEMIELKVDVATDDFTERLKQHPMITAVTADEHSYNIVVQKGSRFFGEIFHLAEDCQVSILSIEVKTPTLEDVFLQLTGRGLRD